MNNINYLLATYATDFSIVLRISSCIILLFFCIPLQIKEALVKNGLERLRKQLLIFGLVLFSTNLMTLYFLLVATLQKTPQKPLNASLQIINAVSFLILSIIGHMIYNQQYDEKSKELHAKIAKMEETS